MTIKLSTRMGNWQAIAFILIKQTLVGVNPHFCRQDLFADKHIEFAVRLSKLLGHKKDAQRAEYTLQNTIQKMRDRGFIIFHGQGDYEITAAGYDEMELLPTNSNYYEIWELLKDRANLAY